MHSRATQAGLVLSVAVMGAFVLVGCNSDPTPDDISARHYHPHHPHMTVREYHHYHEHEEESDSSEGDGSSGGSRPRSPAPLSEPMPGGPSGGLGSGSLGGELGP